MLKVMIVDNESAIRKGLVHCIHWGDLGCEDCRTGRRRHDGARADSGHSAEYRYQRYPHARYGRS